MLVSSETRGDGRGVLFIRSVHRVIPFGIYRHRMSTTHQGDVSNEPRAELMAPASSQCAYQRRVLTNDVCGSGFVRNTAVKLFHGEGLPPLSAEKNKRQVQFLATNIKFQRAFKPMLFAGLPCPLTNPLNTQWHQPLAQIPAGPSTALSPSSRCGLSSPHSAGSSGRGGCWGCAGRRERGRRSSWGPCRGWCCAGDEPRLEGQRCGRHADLIWRRCDGGLCPRWCAHATATRAAR